MMLLSPVYSDSMLNTLMLYGNIILEKLTTQTGSNILIKFVKNCEE